MKRLSSAGSAAGVLFVLLVFNGCGRGDAPARVKGVVKLDGQPYAQAFVVFNPVDPQRPAAHGTTDATGTFYLTTNEPNDGAVPGEYKVTVAAAVTMGSAESMDQRVLEQLQLQEWEKLDAKAREKADPALKAAMEKRKSPIPALYTTTQTTPFHVVLPAKKPIELLITSLPPSVSTAR